VVPGGGWTINAWTHEGVEAARWLAGEGYTAFVLKYRLQATNADPAVFEQEMATVNGLHATPWPTANKPKMIGDLISAVAEVMDADAYHAAREACADDGRRAIELVRANAERFGLRPGALGMIGFSAGAFLIADVALDPRAEQVAFVAPIYGGETQHAPVPADAPPLFTAVSQDDVLVKVVEGLHADWTAADRPAEIHGFARGGHGFGMVRQGAPSDRWTDLFLAWVDDLGL
jgi:acetyl esterase/lipase